MLLSAHPLWIGRIVLSSTRRVLLSSNGYLHLDRQLRKKVGDARQGDCPERRSKPSWWVFDT
jgi:hypothetical protein